MIPAEQEAEWQVPERTYFSRKSMAKVSSSVLAPPAPVIAFDRGPES